MLPSVLIVDDLVSIHEMLCALLDPAKYDVRCASNGAEALEMYKKGRFDVVVADIDMKPMDGITLLRRLKEHHESSIVIIMTAYASTESAIAALKGGAFDYLQKPFRKDQFMGVINLGIKYSREIAEGTVRDSRLGVDAYDLVHSGDSEHCLFGAGLVGESGSVKKILEQLTKVSNVRTPVCLLGERGSGFESIVGYLHRRHSRRECPLIRANCRNQEPGLEAGLIGEEGKGGVWFQRAEQGLLFLEDIDLLPLGVQRRVSAVLRSIGHHVRLICTSMRDLELLTDRGEFCDELFYRIASLPITIPPLRQRMDDLPHLLTHVSARVANPLFDTEKISFSPEALDALRAYPWPGNMTEFIQVISHSLATTNRSVIVPDQLPSYIRGDGAQISAAVGLLHQSDDDRNKRSMMAEELPVETTPRESQIVGLSPDNDARLYPFLMGGLLHNSLNSLMSARFAADALLSAITKEGSKEAPRQTARIATCIDQLTVFLQVMQHISRSFYTSVDSSGSWGNLEGLASTFRSSNPEIEYELVVDSSMDGSLLPAGVVDFVAGELLKNATKSCVGRSSQKISLCVTVTAKEKIVSFECRDSGLGFHPEILGRIHGGRLRLPERGSTGGSGLFFLSEIAGRLKGSLLASNLEPSGARVQLLVSYCP